MIENGNAASLLKTPKANEIMKKNAFLTFLALPIFTFCEAVPSIAQTTAQSRTTESTHWLLESEFKNLGERDRIRIQSHLAEYGLYDSTLDGLWGRNTANALRHAAGMMEQNMGTELHLDNAERARAFLSQFADGSASAFMWGEGGECDGCDQVEQQTLASADLTVRLPKNFQCNAQPRDYWTGNMEVGSIPWQQVPDQVEKIIESLENSAKNGSALRPSDQRQIENIIADHEIPIAAEYYGYVLYDIGDHKGAHEFWAKAAIHGEPSSATLLTISLMGGYDEFKHLSFANPPDARVIVDCLQYAAAGKDDTALIWLASGLVGDPDLPQGVNEVLGVNTNRARELLDAISQEHREEWADDIAEIRKLADELDQERQAKEVAQATDAATGLTSRCDGLVTLKGICWSLKLAEMQTVLLAHGYECSDDLLGGLSCSRGDALIDITEKEITFSCETFDVCAYNFEQVSGFLMEQGVVGAMEASRQFITQDTAEALAMSAMGLGPALAFREPYWQLSSCGKGAQGQVLCVEQPENREVRLVLKKATLGARTPSFE
ncbi:hypothetical protein MED193_15357 [Roseobacter sp. MED193]|nr:hypothetical protein MED193_15357 [Roseobacter sp. MED193]